MSDEPGDPLIEHVAERLRRPMRIDPAVDRRVMTAVRMAPTPRRSWLGRPITLTVMPLRALALAAGLGAVAILGMRAIAGPGGSGAARQPGRGASAAAVQFVLVEPHARSVALVGDFNDWDMAATPLAPTGGLWTVTLPLPPGRYRYAFVVDGARWVRDPTAPAAVDEDFGTPSSVLTVGG